MCLHVLHRGRWQGNDPASWGGGGRGDGEALDEFTRISPKFRSRRYDTSGGSGKIILRASGSEDKMLKLSSMILLLPALNGLYVNTNRTLLLVLSLWLVGVDVRRVDRAFETFLRSLLARLSG